MHATRVLRPYFATSALRLMLLVYSTLRSTNLLRAALGTLRKAPHGLPRQRREAAPNRRAPGKLSSVSGLQLLVYQALSY